MRLLPALRAGEVVVTLEDTHKSLFPSFLRLASSWSLVSLRHRSCSNSCYPLQANALCVWTRSAVGIAWRVIILFSYDIYLSRKCIVGWLCRLLLLRLSSPLYSPPADNLKWRRRIWWARAKTEDAYPEYEDPPRHPSVSLRNSHCLSFLSPVPPPKLPSWPTCS